MPKVYIKNAEVTVECDRCDYEQTFILESSGDVGDITFERRYGKCSMCGHTYEIKISINEECVD